LKGLYRVALAIAILLAVASLVLFVGSAWTGDAFAPVINLIQLLLVVTTFVLALLLFVRLDKGGMLRRLWGLVAMAMFIDLFAVSCEAVNGFARQWKVSQGTVFTIYTLVWLVLIFYPVVLYTAFRREGIPFDWRSITAVLPSLAIVSLATLVVVVIPWLGSGVDLGTKISNLVALVVGTVSVFASAFLTVTMGRGRSGRPWLFVTLALTAAVSQTILTTHVTMVAGTMRVLEPANYLLHLCYLLEIAAEYHQNELLSG
jgi:hypothetical protein